MVAVTIPDDEPVLALFDPNSPIWCFFFWLVVMKIFFKKFDLDFIKSTPNYALRCSLGTSY